MIDSRQSVFPIFHADAPPDVLPIRPKTQPPTKQIPRPPRPLRQNLIGVPIRRDHHVRNRRRIRIRHSVLKQIAHRIDEHQLGGAPGKRLRQLLRHQPQIKPLLVRMSLDPAKPLRKRFGIAVLAAGADFDAAPDGVPGGVGPSIGELSDKFFLSTPNRKLVWNGVCYAQRCKKSWDILDTVRLQSYLKIVIRAELEKCLLRA